MHPALSTLSQVESDADSRRALVGRRVFLAVLATLVGAGAAGLLGNRTARRTVTSGAWTLVASFPRVSRAGLDVSWEVTVQHPGGFGEELVLSVTADYFDVFETQGFFPEPSEVTRDGSTVYFTFTAPAGDTFVVGYDAYVQPAAQQGRRATVSVLDDSRVVASVDIDTLVLP